MRPFLLTEARQERYTREGYWGLPTLIEVFDRNADKHPDKEVFVDSATRVTFSQARTDVDRLALGFLELGYRKDDVLAIQLPNIVEAPLLRLAAYNCGLLALPVLGAFGANEVRHILARSEARGIVIPRKVKERDYVDMVRAMRSDLPALKHIFVVGDDVPDGCLSITAMMRRPIETSYPADYLRDKRAGPWEVQELKTTTGSTGLPKVAESFGGLQILGYVLPEKWRLTEADVIGLPIPFAGGIAQNAWPTTITVPCTLALLDAFSPQRALEFIERERVSVLIGVPAIGEMLVRVENLRDYDVGSLRLFFTAGAPLSPTLAREIEAKLGCTLVALLGSMDFGAISASAVADPVEVRHNSVGKPMPGNEVRIVDENGDEVPPGKEGELVVRGPYSTSAYYHMPEATLEAYGGDKDGWFRTGDLARLDDAGNLYIVGRIKGIIKRGAMTIAPAEIEILLKDHPGVQDVAVVSMPDAILGEKACAFVIPRPGHTFSFDEMRAFLMEKKLATFKIPERLEIVDEFPMIGGQKVARSKLSEVVTEKLKREGRI